MTVFSFVTFFPLSITQTLTHCICLLFISPSLLYFHFSLIKPLFFVYDQTYYHSASMAFLLLYFISHISHTHTHTNPYTNFPSPFSVYLTTYPHVSLPFSPTLPPSHSLLFCPDVSIPLCVSPSSSTPPLPSQVSLTLSTLIHSLLPGATR